MTRPGESWTPEQHAKVQQTWTRKRTEPRPPKPAPPLSCDICSMVHGESGYRARVHVLEFRLERGGEDCGAMRVCRRCWEATAAKRRPRRERAA